jgi:hypothetical protein
MPQTALLDSSAARRTSAAQSGVERCLRFVAPAYMISVDTPEDNKTFARDARRGLSDHLAGGIRFNSSVQF